MNNTDLWQWIILPWRITKFLIMSIIWEFVLFLWRIPGYINCWIAHSKYHRWGAMFCGKCNRILPWA